MKLLLGFLLLAPSLLLAQQKRQKEVTLSLTPLYLQNREAIINSSKNTAFGVALDGSWLKRDTSRVQSFGAGLAVAKPKSAFEPAAYSTWLQVLLQYDYLRALKGGTAFRLLAGGMAQVNYRIGYYPNWDDSHVYWASFLGVGLSGRAEQQIGNRTLYLACSLPLVGTMSRPPASRSYKIENSAPGNLLRITHQHLRIAAPWHYFNPRLALGLTLWYSPRFSSSFFYHLESVRATTSYSTAYRQLTHGVGTTFIF
jgi:hypothetical protein